MYVNRFEHLLLRSKSMTSKDLKKKQEQMHRDLAVNNLRRNSGGDGLRRRRRIHPPLFIYARQVSSDSHETDWGYFPKAIDTKNSCRDNIVQAGILDIEEKVHITSLATWDEKSEISENKVRGATPDNEDNYTNDVSFVPPHVMSSLISASEASGSSTSSLIKLYAPLLPSIMGDDVSDFTDDIIIEDMMMSEEPVRPQRHYWFKSWSKTSCNKTTSADSSRTGACEVGSILIRASVASAVGATIVGAFATGALVVGFSVMGASALVVCIVKAADSASKTDIFMDKNFQPCEN